MDAYLDRIGATRASTLTELQEQHLLTVPFENLDIHLGIRIVPDEALLLDKIVERRRGGFCYELNGAFAALLRSLGYEVRLMAARGLKGDELGPPFDHLALLVDGEWLVDVGFGEFTLHPLRWDSRVDQADPAGVFRLVDLESGDVDVYMNDDRTYRIDPRPRELADFVATCWWQQTAPESYFLQGPLCSLATRTGRVTVAGGKLIRSDNGERSVEPVEDLAKAYLDHFGVLLPHTDFRQRSAAGRLPDLPV